MNTKAKKNQGREKLVGSEVNPIHTAPHIHSNPELPAPDLCRPKSHGCGPGPSLPCRLFPLVLVQVGGGEVWGLTTGANALFCFTAETMLAGEKEKMPEELLQLEGRLVEEAIVGLDGTTKSDSEKGELIQT